MNPAIDLLKLYYEHVGVPGSPATNWFLRNKSTSQAIRATILFSEGNPDLGMKRTEVFSLEPGEIKTIGGRTSQGPTQWRANIVGARFL